MKPAALCALLRIGRAAREWLASANLPACASVGASVLVSCSSASIPYGRASALLAAEGASAPDMPARACAELSSSGRARPESPAEDARAEESIAVADTALSIDHEPVDPASTHELDEDARTESADPGSPAREAQAPAAKTTSSSDPQSAQAVARKLEESFRKQGIHLDLERHVCWIPATVDIRDDLLEYLLVNPKGAAHESVFVTEVVPSVLVTALLALGVEPGRNAVWKERVPPPTAEEMHAGIARYTVDPPQGDGLYMYAAWREKDETYFYRVEDLLRDLETGRSMRRHRWVYLGSRWVKAKGPKPEIFAADYDGNLVNIALFEEGNTLLTAALPECLKQTIWLTNAWLVPQRGAEVAFLFARERLESLPPEIESALPIVAEPADAKPGANDGR